MTLETAEPVVTAVQLFEHWWPWCQAVALIGVFAVMALLAVKL